MRAPEAGGESPTHFGELLLQAAERWPDTDALAFPVGQATPARSTYAALAARAVECSRALRGHDVRRGDHVALLLHNGPAFIAWLGGIALAGAIAAPLNTRHRRAELAHALRDSRARAIVTSGAYGVEPDLAKRVVEVVTQLLRDDPGCRLPSLLRDEDADTRPDAAARVAEPRAPMPQDVDTADVALLIYTSGTTAYPKGCLLRHSTWLRAARLMAHDRFRLAHGDSLWNPLPMFHMAALHPFAACASVGATFLGMSRFEPALALRQLAEEQADVLYAAFPTILADLVNDPDFDGTDLSHVRRINCVGAPDTLHTLQAALPHAVLTSAYGLTEAGGVVAYGVPEEPLDVRVSTCGRPFEGLDARVVDECGRVLPSGEVGELQLRGWCTFAGYWRQPEATRAALAHGDWLRTGDRGALDPGGRIAFHGRLKDVLKVGGENVSAVEVEWVLARHPAVKLAQVVGAPDARLGEVAIAFVELRADTAVPPEELIAHCRAALASYKVPRAVHFVTAWPMSATKIQKHRLLELSVSQP